VTHLPLFDEPTRLPLRDYQHTMLDRVALIKPGEAGLVVAATGLGKGEVAGRIMEQSSSALMLVPFKDLSKQMASRLRSRGLMVGLEQAENVSDDPHTVACYASVIGRERGQKFLNMGLETCIVDEVHIGYSEASLRFLGQLKENGCRIIGMTATPERSGDPITDFYQKVVFNYGIPSATRDGWLCEAKSWIMVVESLDLSDFNLAYGGHGDITPPKNGDSLAKLMAKEQTVQCIASSVYQHYDNKPSIVFCAGVNQANRLRECLHDRGLESSIVHSRMDKAERGQHLSDFESGLHSVIINVGCLTVGYDFPPASKVFLARPTASRSRFTQMVGRCTRPLKGVVDGKQTPEERKQAIAESGKPYFEIFDITDSSRRCDLLSSIDLWLEGKPMELVDRVKRRVMNNTSGVSVEDVDEVAEYEEEILKKEKAAATAAELRRSGGVISAGFGVYGRDQFAEREEIDKPKYRGWHILWGKLKGWPLPEAITKDFQWVQWHLTKLRPKDEAYASAIVRELRKQGRIK